MQLYEANNAPTSNVCVGVVSRMEHLSACLIQILSASSSEHCALCTGAVCPVDIETDRALRANTEVSTTSGERHSVRTRDQLGQIRYEALAENVEA